MRIILDTDKKTITVPWNYQDKLNAMNAMIMEVTGDESKKKTFKGYINDICRNVWQTATSTLSRARSPRSRTKRADTMAKRVTPAEIVEMNRLYNEYGNYAEVGRRMGRSGSTVAKYIKLDGTPKIVKHTFQEVVREG